MKEYWTRVWHSGRMLWKALLTAAVVGVIAGLIGSSLWHIISWCGSNFEAHSELVWLLWAGGLVIALLYGHFKNVSGTNEVLEAVRGTNHLSPAMLPLVYVSTIITRFFGGSVGTEGAAIQIGGGIAATCARVGHLKEEQTRVVLMAGISGGFAAVVGTPVTAVILAMEIAGVGVMYYAAILPCAVSAAIGFAISGAFGTDFPKFHMDGIPALAPLPILQVMLLAFLCGLVSILLCVCIKQAGRFYEHFIPNLKQRAVAGGLVLAFLTFLVGSARYNGGGLSLIDAAAKGEAEWADFLLKIVFTALTLGAGYKGGAIVPTLVTGAAFGGFFGPVIGLAPSLSAGIGMTAVFCGAINCPMTSFILGLEVFGVDASLYFLLACAVSYVCSGYYSLYPAQKILNSKVGNRSIDQNGI